MTIWPAPVVRLYLGQLTPEALFAAADNPNAEVRAARMCAANFYAGEYLLQQGKKDDAARLFKPVAAGCQKDLIHFESARSELKTLGAL
jgi:lipoprotein NlpI